MVDREDTLATFRDRLAESIARAGATRGSVAERAGVDRSTLTQLLSPRNRRLPRLDTVVALALDQNVSIDWLVGLSNVGPMQAKMIDTEFARTEREHGDEQLVSWFADTVGHKVRHVPSTIPDLVKTEAVIRFESTQRDDATIETGARVEASAARLALSKSPATEIEVCSAYQAITAIAQGEGIWSRLSMADRKQQLDQIAELTGDLYPRFRWFLFDGSMRYAAPITVFGPLRAALYLGQNYLVLTSAEHVRVLIRDFDELIKAAIVQPPDVARFVGRLKPQ